VRTLAVTSPKRVPELPDVPTLAESGLPESTVTTWSGLYVPAGTPGAIVETLNAELNKMLQSAEVKERLAGAGLAAVGGTPDTLGNYLKSEIARWSKVVKDARITIQ